MPPAHYRYGSTLDGAPNRRRAVALALTIIIHALLLLLLLHLAPGVTPKKIDDSLPVTFSLTPGPPASREKEQTKVAEKAAEGAAPKAVTPPAIKPPDAPPTPDFPFITLTKDQLASADIGKMPTRASSQAGNGTGDTGSGQDKGAVAGPGEGPGGEQLFDADWYRRPTNAELATYMPANAPRNGWGLVACKTVDDYHVENCQQLGESPLGSGFARAVRQAAWQFLIRPPRIGGKSQVGAWVRIRIDYVEGVAK